MLGRLAKWLRVLGYDTHYQGFYPEGSMEPLLRGEGRTLLTRSLDTFKTRTDAVFIRSDHVGEQLRQLKEEGWIRPDPSRAFLRCPVCNTPLVAADAESVRDRVPEYVFYRHAPDIRRCPSCGRHYWHGSHRGRMQEQLEAWRLVGPSA